MAEGQKADTNSKHVETDAEAVAAHQLKVPLARNKWGISYILSGQLGEVPSSQREVLQSVFENNERAIRIANDILLARDIDQEGIQKLEIVNLGNLVQKVIEEFNPEASAKNVTLSFSQDSQVEVLGTKDRLSYVFENIIGDALQYSQEGGSINVSLSKKDQNVILSISDTGMGIPEEEQGRIFEKFFRARNAQEHNIDGTGLGLYVSKKILESFGGQIRFQSKEGHGTTFLISLPLREGV